MNNCYSLYENCTLCPRKCLVDRTSGQKGVCLQSSSLFLARAALHMWEEPIISGTSGSGAVFFCGCNLKCEFCQNYSISNSEIGKEISPERLSEIYLELRDQGAHNINLVTPTHYLPHVIDSLQRAKKNGLNIPIVYNTSGYESSESLKRLDGLIDIYLPDFKYYSSELSLLFSKAPDYFDVAKDAFDEMFRQVGKAVINENTGLMEKGIIARHLILPGCTSDSRKVLKYLYDTYKDLIYISIMNQYTPMKHVLNNPRLNRKITRREYDLVVDYAINLGIENAFIQEGDTVGESFIPDFNCDGL